MTYQRIRKSSSRSPQVQKQDSPLARRLFPAQTQPVSVPSADQLMPRSIPSTEEWLANHPLLRSQSKNASIQTATAAKKPQFELAVKDNSGTHQNQGFIAPKLNPVTQLTSTGTQIQRWGISDVVGGIQNAWNSLKGASANPNMRTVTDSKALLRDPEQNWKSTGEIIPKDSQVEILETQDQYVQVQEVLPQGMSGAPRLWGWTKVSNLSSVKSSEEKPSSNSNNPEPTAEEPKANDKPKVKASDIKNTKTYEAGKSDTTSEILENTELSKALQEAQETPETWFNNFADITFLGRGITAPIHRILAAHLKNVEANFISQTGAKDPKEAGDKLGLTRKPFAGGRASKKNSEGKESSGMHVFGLAIDLDVTENPWIAMPNKKDNTQGGGEEKWSNIYYGYMQELLGGEQLQFKRDFNLGKHKGVSYEDRLTATIENILKLDKMVENYFSLLELENETILQALLSKTTSSRWKGKTPEQAREQINQDLIQCGKIWRRTSDKEVETIRKGGITNLSEELIRGMDLYWGGMFGDIMHFDMRDKGIGAKLYKVTRDS